MRPLYTGLNFGTGVDGRKQMVKGLWTRNGIRAFFNCVSYVYMALGVFGVCEAERLVACCMYAYIA
jgi:hypothetical protein